MAKNFSAAINEIMPLVMDGDKSTPFVISKYNGEWAVDYPISAETARQHLANIRDKGFLAGKKDPCAVMFTGADFSKGSFAYVYDKVLLQRLFEEEQVILKNREADVKSGAFDNNKLDEFCDTLEDYISELSQGTVDYLTSIDNPLEWLYDEFVADLDLSPALLTKDEKDVLYDKFHAEYNALRKAADFNDDYSSLMMELDFDYSLLSDTTMRYLAAFEAPLSKLFEMIPFELCYEDEVTVYGKKFSSPRLKEAITIASESIDANDANAVLPGRYLADPLDGSLFDESLKNTLFAAINERAKEGSESTKNRYIAGYEEKNTLQLAGKLVMFAENTKSNEPYMVCNIRWDNPLGTETYEDAIVTGDYLEAIHEYIKRGAELLDFLESERGLSGLPVQTLTAADCVPNGLTGNLDGKVIVIKPEALSPEYRVANHQLKICVGGFGASPDSRGSAVFCRDLYSDKESRFERNNVAGIIDPAKMPEWAKKKLALIDALKEPGVFEYGGYHFKPERQFRKGETDRHLEGDSRPEKKDAHFAMRNMSSDFGLGLRNYIAGEYGAGKMWSYKDFYAASGNGDSDIFKCIENGKLYVPAENELFRYKEPERKEKSHTVPKPDLLAKINGNKQKVERDKAANAGAPRKTKKPDKEV